LVTTYGPPGVVPALTTAEPFPVQLYSNPNLFAPVLWSESELSRCNFGELPRAGLESLLRATTPFGRRVLLTVLSGWADVQRVERGIPGPAPSLVTPFRRCAAMGACKGYADWLESAASE
jgi:hypothetical protein